MGAIWDADWFSWALGIGIGLPLVTIVLGILIAILGRRGSHLGTALGIVQWLVLPALATIVWLTHVIGWSPQHPGVKAAVTVFWLVALVALLSFLNALIFRGAGQESWRARIPRIFTDVARLIVIAVGLAIILSAVWGYNVGGLIAAISLSSLVLALGLQNSLGAIVTGLLLLFEQPFQIGEWLEFNGQIGRVIQVNWRAVHLDTATGIQIVPNSALATVAFGNISRNPQGHATAVTLHFALQDPPNVVKATLREVAAALSSAAPGRAPEVRITDVVKDEITYVTTIYVVSLEQVDVARDEFLTRSWYAARRRHLTLLSSMANLADERDEVAAGLRRAAPIFRVEATQLAETARNTRLLHFAAGETIVRQGEQVEGLHLILSGGVQLRTRDSRRGDIALLDLARGDTFGETALTGEPSLFTVVARGDVAALLFESDELHTLMARTPRLTQQLDETMEQRRSLRRKLLAGLGAQPLSPARPEIAARRSGRAPVG